jgi:2-dehydropantoate 2-reductase
MANPNIVIAGAGSIGCFVGGVLAAAGYRVVFLGRPRILDTIREHGLTLTDFSGMSQTVAPLTVAVSTDPAVLAEADIVLVTVKSGATAEMTALIAQHARPGVTVVSLQNGLSNVETLASGLPGLDVRAGMVPFNVVPMDAGRFHRSTSGDVLIEPGPGDVGNALTVLGLTVQETPDIAAIQWGKLLINLSNAPNALSGLTIRQQLLNRDWRRVVADQIAEALRVLKAEKITAISSTGVPVPLIPHILRLPTPLFRRIAAQMLTIDASARSSMSYDLMQHRTTEVDALQGEIIARAARHGIPVPMCTRVAEQVKLAENAGQGQPNLSVSVLRRAAS